GAGRGRDVQPRQPCRCGTGRYTAVRVERDRGLPLVPLPAGYMRVGAIDIGTNSIRLLVADIRSRPGPRELVTVARAGEPCRLGRGLGRSGEVDDEMADRVATLAAEFAKRARSLGVTHIVLGATAALREAT